MASMAAKKRPKKGQTWVARNGFRYEVLSEPTADGPVVVRALDGKHPGGPHMFSIRLFGKDLRSAGTASSFFDRFRSWAGSLRGKTPHNCAYCEELIVGEPSIVHTPGDPDRYYHPHHLKHRTKG